MIAMPMIKSAINGPGALVKPARPPKMAEAIRKDEG
jgi:hypothetical protein